MSVSLSSKTAFVTGASRVIGRATALALASRGAYLLVHYCSGGAEAESVVEEILQNGGKAEATCADLSMEDGPHEGKDLKERFAIIDPRPHATC